MGIKKLKSGSQLWFIWIVTTSNMYRRCWKLAVRSHSCEEESMATFHEERWRQCWWMSVRWSFQVRVKTPPLCWNNVLHHTGLNSRNVISLILYARVRPNQAACYTALNILLEHHRQKTQMKMTKWVLYKYLFSFHSLQRMTDSAATASSEAFFPPRNQWENQSDKQNQ